MSRGFRNLAVFFLTGSTLSCFAQDLCQKALEDIVYDSTDKRTRPPNEVIVNMAGSLSVGTVQSCLAQLFHFATKHDQIPRNRLKAIQQSLQGRLSNQQLSAPNGTQGTTSPISKPGASILSVIEDDGGVTTSNQNSTTTIQISPYKVPEALVAKGWIPYCNQALAISSECISYGTIGMLNRLSLGITANTTASPQSVTGQPATGATSSGSTQQITATAMGKELPSFSGASAKYVLWYQKGGAANFDDVAKEDPNFDSMLVKLTDDIEKDPFYLQWKTCLTSELSNAIWVDPNSQDASKTVKPDALKRVDGILADYESIKDVLLGNPYSCSGVAPTDADRNAAKAAGAPILAEIRDLIAELDKISALVDGDLLKSMTTPALSVEYDFNTPLNQPSNSTAKVAYSYVHALKLKNTNALGKAPSTNPSCPFTQAAASSSGQSANGSNGSGGSGSKPAGTVACPSWTLTINAGLSWYSSAPSSAIPGASLLRDAQAGIEWDKNIASSKWVGVGKLIGDTTFSATYYYQDQTSPSILNVTPGSPSAGITLVGLPSTATQVFAAKGNINFAQLKYGFGTGTNVKFPIAVSWSNRTDLIQHSSWGAQIGISYDFSSLFGSSGNGANKTP